MCGTLSDSTKTGFCLHEVALHLQCSASGLGACEGQWAHVPGDTPSWPGPTDYDEGTPGQGSSQCL